MYSDLIQIRTANLILLSGISFLPVKRMEILLWVVIFKEMLHYQADGFGDSLRNKTLLGRRLLGVNSGMTKTVGTQRTFYTLLIEAPRKVYRKPHPFFSLTLNILQGTVLTLDFELIDGPLLNPLVFFTQYFQFSLKKSNVVSEFYHSSSWNLHLRRNIRDDELIVISSLLSILNDFHPSPSRQNTRFWSFLFCPLLGFLFL